MNEPPRLTRAQRMVLFNTASSASGIAEYRNTHGLGHSSWERKMIRLCELGYFRPYVHGGYEITEAGKLRAAGGTEK